MVVGLGGLNLFGVVILGTMLKYVRLGSFYIVVFNFLFYYSNGLHLYFSLKGNGSCTKWIYKICQRHFSSTSGTSSLCN